MVRVVAIVLVLTVCFCNTAFAKTYKAVQKIKWEERLVSYLENVYPDATIEHRIIQERSTKSSEEGLTDFKVTVWFENTSEEYSLIFTTWDSGNQGYVDTIRTFFDVVDYYDDPDYIDSDYFDLILNVHYFFLKTLDIKNHTNVSDDEFSKSAPLWVNYYCGKRLDYYYSMTTGYGDNLAFWANEIDDGAYIYYILDMRDIMVGERKTIIDQR